MTITETETVIANSSMAGDDNMSDFRQILTSLLSADNHVRQTAKVNINIFHCKSITE